MGFAIPIQDLLESYPFPAFVLVCPASSSTPTPATPIPTPTLTPTPAQTSAKDDIPSPPLRPFSSSFPVPTWANERWNRATNGYLLQDCLQPDAQTALVSWLDARVMDHGPGSPVALDDSDLDGGWDDDRNGDNLDTALSATYKALTLDFNFPQQPGRLELVASVLPRMFDSTHMGLSVLITTVPRPRRRAGSRHSPRPPVRHCQGSLDTSRTPSSPLPARSSTPGSVVSLLPGDKPAVPQSGNGSSNADKKGSLEYYNHKWVDERHARGDPIFVGAEGDVKTIPAKLWMSITPTLDEVKVSKDWSTTPLGMPHTWPKTLQSMVFCMQELSPLPSCIWWGHDHTFLYNQMFGKQIPDHPRRYGTFGPESLKALKENVGEFYDALMSGSTIFKNDQFYLRKDAEGIMREGFHRAFWVPIPGDDGKYGGIWHVTRQTTELVISDRRTAVLRELGARTSTVRTLHSFQSGILETLLRYPKDVPFALLYYVDEPSVHDRTRADPHSAQLRFAGGVGVPDEHDSAPEVVSVSLLSDETPMLSKALDDLLPSPATSHSSTFESVADLDPGWGFAEVLTHRRTVTIDCSQLIQGYPVRVWESLPTEAVVMPISLNSDDGLPAAVLVLGISTRLDYDQTYRLFVEDLRFLMASQLSAVRSYAANERRLADLASLDRAKSLMFSNVSHELLAPLTLISGPLDDVLAEATPQDGHTKFNDSLTMARRNVNRLSRLVAMLMDIAALDAGKHGSFVRVNLGVLTRDVAGLFRKAASKSKLQYTVLCDERSPRRSVYVDMEGWEKIVCCLIENAIKYTTEGFVHVCLEYTSKSAVLTVTFTGVGMVEDVEQRLSLKEGCRDRGTSMGSDSAISLMLASKLVNLHHSDLEIESRTMRETPDGTCGTVFRVRLPLGSSHLAPESIGVAEGLAIVDSPHPQFGEEVATWYEMVVDDTDTNSSTVSSGDSKRSRGIDARVLNFTKEDVIMVVEDLPDAQQYMRTIFEPYCTVVVARNGQDALEKYDKNPPHLVIADVMLPVMNGVELLDALRAGTREQQLVPVILLTTINDVRTTDMLRADDYLPKPFNARDIVVRANMQMQLGKKRRSMEILFEERTQELRCLSEETPVGIFRCDDIGRRLFSNQAWRDMCGIPEGHGWVNFAHDDTKQSMLQQWSQFLTTDQRTIELETFWSNNRWVLLTAAKLYTISGATRGVIGCGIDITERKLNDTLQAQRIVEAEKRRAEAEEARLQQELLIDITSHEIRNPISSLRQCSSMVRNNLLELQDQLKTTVASQTLFEVSPQLLLTMDEDLEALDSIYQCGLAQERISNDVLSLGKMQLDLLHMFDVETDMPKVAQKVLSIFQSEARMNRITLSLQVSSAFEDMGLETVMTDPVRFTQIVTNLISNAIRFTANNTERRVELKLDAGTELPQEGSCVNSKSTGKQVLAPETPIYIFVSVSDTGPGLTPSELESLFQRFTQASPMTHTVFGGSGLGLFVCHKLAERMGGRIEVASTYGKGSEFRFFIRTIAGRIMHSATPTGGDEAAVGPVSTPRLPVTPRMEAPPEIAQAAPLVLVVEDNLINRKVLLRQLKHVGFRSDSASNGLEGLQKIARCMDKVNPQGERYDCVLMDIEMPVMDGYTASRKVREAEAAGVLDRSIIIALTGNARQAQLQERMTDFDLAVIKPYRLNDLLDKMEGLMSRRDELAAVAAEGYAALDEVQPGTAGDAHTNGQGGKRARFADEAEGDSEPLDAGSVVGSGLAGLGISIAPKVVAGGAGR